MVEACWQKWYCYRKIGRVNLKPGDLILVKADAFKGKRKIKDRWEEETGRWCIRAQQMSPLTKWWTSTECHESSPEINFFSLHQRLVLPCVWAAIIHRTGVPVPPHAILPLEEVKWRGCHKRTMVRQSPDDLPVKLPWGGKMGSCNFCHGHLLEHPLRTGEDLR